MIAKDGDVEKREVVDRREDRDDRISHVLLGRNGRENGKRNENEEQQKVYSGTFEIGLLEYFKMFLHKIDYSQIIHRNPIISSELRVQFLLGKKTLHLACRFRLIGPYFCLTFSFFFFFSLWFLIFFLPRSTAPTLTFKGKLQVES